MAVGKGLASRLRDRIAIERPIADDSLNGAGSGTWSPVATVWAEVQDVLPSRAEQLAGGINIATRPARVRMRYRQDVSADMRFVMGQRIMQIVAGPAEIGRREAIDFMVESYSTAGNPA